MQSSLYNCTVFHRRQAPSEYGFTSRIFMWHIDLDELEEMSRSISIFSHNRANLYSFRDEDHLFMGKDTLRENVETYLKENGVQESVGKITLLTNLRTMGYVFNPVSFYFCYDESADPLAVVVEVHNTFGELKPFLLKREDLSGDQFNRKHPKFFYISPFSGLDQTLEIKAKLPNEHLALYVNNYENGEEKPFFRSSLTGTRTPLTNRSLLAYSLRFPFITLKVICLIHWHAFKMYLKKIPFYGKSENSHLQKGIIPKRGQTPYSQKS